jgi:hypothetical protein
MQFTEQTDHCENACKFYRGWFIKVGHETKKIKDPSQLPMPDQGGYTPIPFIYCACMSETKPFYIYKATARMIKILGCGKFEEEWRSDNNEYLLKEISDRAQKEIMAKTLAIPAQDAPNVKESDTWTRINKKPSGQSVHQSVQIDRVRDLSVTNVDRLPESVHEMMHPRKKRISGISIFKAEEFNAGDPFAQMKSDEVDDFYGEDDAP